MKIQYAAAFAALAFAVSGCASPEVISARQPGDDNLTCSQLTDQYEDAQTFEKKARAERGVTGKNVAAALLFWPALIGTYSNTDDAINAAQERQRRLERLASDKKCSL